MATKTVEMATRDPQTKKLVMDEVEVEVVTVNIRNRDLKRTGGHVFNSAVSGMTFFRPGDIKTLDISDAEVAEVKARKSGPWEITTTAPTPAAEDDEQDYEPTSSQASQLAAAAAEDAAEVLDHAPQRVQRRKLRE